jgi:hypothetical protein
MSDLMPGWPLQVLRVAVLAVLLVSGARFAEAVPLFGSEFTFMQQYSTEFVLRNLGLDTELSSANSDCARVVSLGEGMNGLVPLLVSLGHEAVGVDVWYEQEEFPEGRVGDQMREYVESNRGSLLAADAASVPLAGQSQHFVVSHMLIDNLDPVKQRTILKEAVVNQDWVPLMLVHGEPPEEERQQVQQALDAMFAQYYREEVNEPGLQEAMQARLDLVDLSFSGRSERSAVREPAPNTIVRPYLPLANLPALIRGEQDLVSLMTSGKFLAPGFRGSSIGGNGSRCSQLLEGRL